MYRWGIEQVREAKSSREKKDKAVSFFKKWLRKKYSSSRQSSETKPNVKLVFVNCEPLHYLEFNKPNKQNVPEINSVNKFNFSPSQNNCWPTDYRLVTFLFLPHFDLICDLLLDRCTATWNLFVKIMHALIGKF